MKGNVRKCPPAAFSLFCRAHVQEYATRVKRAAALLDGIFEHFPPLMISVLSRRKITKAREKTVSFLTGLKMLVNPGDGFLNGLGIFTRVICRPNSIRREGLSSLALP